MSIRDRLALKQPRRLCGQASVARISRQPTDRHAREIVDNAENDNTPLEVVVVCEFDVLGRKLLCLHPFVASSVHV